MDRNSDGRVTLSDLENLCIRYLVGEAGLSQNITATNYKSYEETAKRSVPGSYTAVGSYGGGPYTSTSYNPDPYGTTVQRTYEYEASPYLTGELDKKAGVSATLTTTTTNVTLGVTTSYQSDLTRSAIYIQRGKLDQIRRVFDKFDEDGNGFIDERELKKTDGRDL